MFCKVELMYF